LHITYFTSRQKIRKDQTLNIFRLELGNKISLPFFFFFPAKMLNLIFHLPRLNLSAYLLLFYYFYFFVMFFSFFFFFPAPPIRGGNISLHAVAVFMFREAQASPQPLADSNGLWALAAVVHVCSQPKLKQGNNSPLPIISAFVFSLGAANAWTHCPPRHRQNEYTDF